VSPTNDRAASPRRSRADRPKPKRAAKSGWRWVTIVLAAAFALLIVLPAAVFGVYYVAAEVPRPGDIPTNQVATILASDGTTQLAQVIPPEGNRTEVTMEQIPPHVRDAVIAAEDRDFYTNPGFSFSGLARAVRDNVLGREDAGGGSTITQQYVKNALVGSERTLVRKMKELVISTKMAREWSKEEILLAYLNTIYFGRGAYGIAAAANAYFDKPVEELTVGEGAVLAASIQQPSLLDPETNPQGARDRWNYVLDGMVEIQRLDPSERQGMEYPEVRPLSSLNADTATPGPNGLIRAQVLRELSELDISETTLNTQGLQITTTIDPLAQDAAVSAVENNLSGQPEDLRTAVVSVDPRTGAVRAYYGGDEGAGYDFAQAGLQTGSTFKVFGLQAALEQGIPVTQLYDSSPLTVNGITISNVGGASCGVCSLAQALKMSLNTSYYRLMLSLENGPEDVKEAAHQAGIPREIPGLDHETLTEGGDPPNNGIILGQYQVRPIDMASAYATFAASGVYHEPYFVQKVTTANGRVIFDRGEPDGERRMRAAVADNVTSAMRPIAAYSNGHALAGGQPSAAKTGTTQLGDTGQNRDAWMVGYTPSLSTAVWIGTAEGGAITNAWGGPIYGSTLPSDIWKDTMDGALANTPWEDFPEPEAIGGSAGVPQYTPPPTTEAPTPTETETETGTPTSVPDTTTMEIPVAPGLTFEVPIPGEEEPGGATTPPESIPEESPPTGSTPAAAPAAAGVTTAAPPER
jgi:membrane peptidoglycan carboxypeptidase